ncbi:GNAT family N-acetyltransferase [Kiloniella laminariae]|uniref:GNAT family N-acetyltransferase n=1 Tax=Kiloniella laminariae TaxID=454162 RepID=UPI000366AD13|nr:GNAT family N-acetyltransferase [Kiloniella laminariae]
MQKKLLPSFESERLLVRPRVLGDLEDCLAMDRDPEVTRYIPGPWKDPQAHRDFVLARMNADYPAGLGYWSVVARAAPEIFLGWVLLLAYPDEILTEPSDLLPDSGQVEIGWRFVRAAWGKGYASEAAALILKHALALPGVHEVVADIDPENAGSIRVAEKIGMTFCGERRVDGIWARSYRAQA